MKNNRPIFTEEETKRIFNKTNGNCGYCGLDLIYKHRLNSQNNAWHIDHIKPLAEGGHPNHLNNLIAACVSCNLKKGKMSYGEFINIIESEQPGLLDKLASGLIDTFIFAATIIGGAVATKVAYDYGKSYFKK